MIETLSTELAPARAVQAQRLSLGRLIGLTHLSFAHQFLWTALLIIVIPAQVVTIAGERNKTTALAGVLIIGALIACVTQVVSGALSDRATFRLGRRRPFIIVGTLIALVGLAFMSTAHSIFALGASFLLLQFGFNVSQAAYQAVVPDYVATHQRGTASGLLAFTAMLGVIVAATISGIVVKEGDYASFSRIYWLTIMLNAALTATTVLVLREKPPERAEPFDLRRFLAGLWIDPRAHPDFTWVFVTRFFVLMGYWTVLTFLLYYVRDVVGSHNAEQVVSRIVQAVTLGATVTSILSGLLSDRIGRKPLVYASSGLVAAVSLSFIFTHTAGMAVVVGALWGLGWGIYLSVDWALATDVLPRPQNAGQASSFARYMGVWSLAAILPQVLAPVIGPVIDLINGHSVHGGYTFMFVVVFAYFLLGAVLLRNVRTAR